MPATKISNYAQPGQCLHNRVYWENRPYYGFGRASICQGNGLLDTWGILPVGGTSDLSGGVIDCPQTPPDEFC